MPRTDITHALPPVIASHIAASNAADRDAYLATFSDDALVNNIQREFRGKAAIGQWVDREIFGAHVTMAVVSAADHHGDVILVAKLDGSYDKTGLPDPLLLTFYFTLRDGKIVMLITLNNKAVQPQAID